MGRKLLRYTVVLALAVGAFGMWLTRPNQVDMADFVGLTGDKNQGEMVYYASGCRSCHMSSDKSVKALSGGMAFPSPFGTFYAPNVSMDKTQGIGGWTLEDFANAVIRGVSPTGSHYYPAFPYTSYGKMTPTDLVDLWAYFRTMPTDPMPSKQHDVSFPFNIRRGLGIWKPLYVSDDWTIKATNNERGRYLGEALGHCAECHTPRDAIGGLDRSRWLAGAPDPSGKGRTPAITPDKLQWSADDIAYYLESGFTPDFDSVGGHMADVVDNVAQLPAEDRQAIAEYLIGLN